LLTFDARSAAARLPEDSDVLELAARRIGVPRDRLRVTR
jgi:hypothetical protein